MQLLPKHNTTIIKRIMKATEFEAEGTQSVNETKH